jgi:hypothetical protein
MSFADSLGTTFPLHYNVSNTVTRVSLSNHCRPEAEHGIWGSNRVIVRHILKARNVNLCTRSTQKPKTMHASGQRKMFLLFRFEYIVERQERHDIFYKCPCSKRGSSQPFFCSSFSRDDIAYHQVHLGMLPESLQM